MISWQPIETAPKDGTIVVLTRFADNNALDQFAMQWAHIQRNGLFPGKVGMWTAPNGSFTWNDDDPLYAPTHWMPSPGATR
jgi:hypothetical protein